ncbi:hypothetical protein RRG08_014488 [Elysia crispata]|uniref:G-protein coupled receptors family 3 profile domain-containing protein n=1 Tax=Elysia crispata TaxID=231223 RepID=A0AAE0XSF0_9GAST|nr:hypothetical protein RRG08_014488 [Elysia crispata]
MRDIHLAGRILALVALDIMFIIVWISIDPLRMSVTELNKQVDVDDDDHYVIPLVSTCVSDYELYWVGAMLVYKGVLLFFGIFLAWETRGIRVDALNDSRLIGLCVYNVAVICSIVVPLSFILGDEYLGGRYIIKSLFLILCTTVTQCIVFLPKIYCVYRDPTGDVDIRFQTNPNGPTTGTFHSSKVLPLKTLTENISIQRRLEKLLKEKEQRIAELESYLPQTSESGNSVMLARNSVPTGAKITSQPGISAYTDA